MLTKFGKKATTLFHFCSGQSSGRSVLLKSRIMSLTSVSCPTVPLSNGLRIPILGLGTSHRGGYCHDAVVYALTDCGLRHIDTAKYYGCEEELGKAIKESGVPRSDLWITNKLWSADYGYESAKKTCLDSCSNMGLEYFDLYLLHWPDAMRPGCSNREIRAETWRALEELYKDGVCRAIGVSNFVVHHLEQLKEDCSVVPHVNQMEYHPFQQPKDLMDYCRQEGIVFTGFSPLARGELLSNPVVCQIAEKHQRTPSQICIRWSIQTGIVTIPKSTKKSRVQENWEVLKFQLEEADMAALTSLHDGRRVSWDPATVE
ncbi:prostaglandin F synthase [Stegastes partitus]|uniref:Prostaglandin F synthase-like n=1 Tax=Stegastes partitus TaxID=144197 RepID=A0A3B5AZV1_9TELE|nr:PREDICTED: prostaglandin F synthase-like [Stegastes partitus]XP_008290738.1 PREDICTED: prostaglandin F synthase-like [Stegastes partitus]